MRMRADRRAWKLRIRLRERAMVELLSAAYGALDLDDLPVVATHLLAALTRRGRRGQDDRALCREAAQLLRDQCVRLGVPCERYASDEWQALGLGLPLAA